MLSLIPEHGEHLLAVVIIGNAILKWVGGWRGETYIFVKKFNNNVVNTAKTRIANIQITRDSVDRIMTLGNMPRMCYKFQKEPYANKI